MSSRLQQKLRKRRDTLRAYTALPDVRRALANVLRPRIYDCPCCGYLTGEDQDDHNADEVLGGPNYQYSLTVAREYFDRDLTSYDANSQRQYIEGQLRSQKLSVIAVLAILEHGVEPRFLQCFASVAEQLYGLRKHRHRLLPMHLG